MDRHRVLVGGLALAVASVGLGLALGRSEEGDLIILGATETSTFPLTSSYEIVPSADPALLDRLNAARARHGTEPLTRSEVLHDAAGAYATRMYETGRLSHIDNLGQSPFDRLRNANVPYVVAGETIGLADSLDQIMDGFLRSDSHRSVLLDPAFCEFGAGTVQGESGVLVVLIVRRWVEPEAVGVTGVDAGHDDCAT